MPSLLLGLGMYLLWGPSCAGVAVVKHFVASCQTYFQCVMSARRNHPDATEADITVGVQRERTCQTVKPWHQTQGKIPDATRQGQGQGGETRLFEKTLKKKNFLSSSSFWNKNCVHSIFTASRPPIRRKTPSRSSTSHRSISFGVLRVVQGASKSLRSLACRNFGRQKAWSSKFDARRDTLEKQWSHGGRLLKTSAQDRRRLSPPMLIFGDNRPIILSARFSEIFWIEHPSHFYEPHTTKLCWHIVSPLVPFKMESRFFEGRFFQQETWETRLTHCVSPCFLPSSACAGTVVQAFSAGPRELLASSAQTWVQLFPVKKSLSFAVLQHEIRPETSTSQQT